MTTKTPQEITKRSGKSEGYNRMKIINAIRKVFEATGADIEETQLQHIPDRVEALIMEDERDFTVEAVQDMVERTLMESGFFDQAKSYILYRDTRRKKRKEREGILHHFPDFPELSDVLVLVEKDFPEEEYDLGHLHRKFISFSKGAASLEERINLLIRSAIELTDKEAPRFEMIAGRLYNVFYLYNINHYMQQLSLYKYYDKLNYLTQQGLAAPVMLQTYSALELEEAAGFIRPQRDLLFPYSGIELLTKRYVICDRSHRPLETVQEMYLNIALFLAIPEKPEQRLYWVKRFYDMLSTLKVTMATPTLANARKPFHQLSSCFIDTVPDDLQGIYRSISNFANVSKYGGGMGLYFGKVRSHGSDIRGFEGAAGGVIRWIRLANDTAVAVDQLGVRQGAVAVYLDVWHRDLPEFLQMRTNNGDDRMKAHDVFPAICFPDYFWLQVEENIEADWHMFDPHEVKKKAGYSLEDSFGEEWEAKYLSLVKDHSISRRSIAIKDLIRMIIKSAVETGTPFTFNRDAVNRANPNPHKGMIYCSNLCTEIAQNMSAVELVDERIEIINGETVVVNVTKPGDYVVCNLA
ncbi:MAG: ribonucleoside-diphosphate reductase subunit alpha, partial [Clostridiales bacterium]|nr:ribonucleoside-diphosphate reductase subunit alpha [Clostridiales bacterium]